MPASPLNTLEVSSAQGTTGEKPLDLEQLLSLRMMFLLLDAWDRNYKSGTPVDTEIESRQGEQHAQAVSAPQKRAT